MHLSVLDNREMFSCVNLSDLSSIIIRKMQSQKKLSNFSLPLFRVPYFSFHVTEKMVHALTSFLDRHRLFLSNLRDLFPIVTNS